LTLISDQKFEVNFASCLTWHFCCLSLHSDSRSTL